MLKECVQTAAWGQGPVTAEAIQALGQAGGVRPGACAGRAWLTRGPPCLYGSRAFLARLLTIFAHVYI